MRFAGAALAAILVASSIPVMAQRPAPEGRTIKGAMFYKLLPHDGIPAIYDPTFVGAKEAEAFMVDDEIVLGVSDGEHARCYSTWLLEGHEVVNDWLGDVPIVAQW